MGKPPRHSTAPNTRTNNKELVATRQSRGEDLAFKRRGTLRHNPPPRKRCVATLMYNRTKRVPTRPEKINGVHGKQTNAVPCAILLAVARCG